MPKLTSSQHGPFSGGVDASGGAFYQPKGSVPRSSNLLGIARGSLATCDGSAITAWKSGAIQLADTRFMALEVFQPTGVVPYLLALKQVSYSIGVPYNMTIAPAAPNTGVPDQGLNTGDSYVYAITALDGVGGESAPVYTNSGNGVTGSGGYTITWTGIPGAFAYNVYRNDLTAGTGYQLLASSAGAPPCGGLLPVPAMSQQIPSQACGSNDPGGSQFSYTDNGNHQFVVDNSGNPVTPPSVDTNSQTALLRIFGPNTSQPQSYDSSNVVALFPPPIQKLGVPTIIGNQQIPAGQQVAGNAPVQIVSPPVGLQPLTASITSANHPSNPTQVSMDIPAPAGLQVNDTVRLLGSGAVTNFALYTVTSFSGNTLSLSRQSGSVASPQVVQFDLVQVTTTSTYTGLVTTMQPISGVSPGGYNGTWQVRVGGTGTVFVVQIPGANGLPSSGGGSFGVIAPLSASSRATPATPPTGVGTQIAAATTPGLSQYTAGVVSIGRSPGSSGNYVVLTFASNAFPAFPGGMQSGDAVTIDFNTGSFNGVYTIIDWQPFPNSGSAADISMRLLPKSGTNPPTSAVSFNGTAFFNLFQVTLLKSITIPSSISSITITGATGTQAGCAAYDGNWPLRVGGNGIRGGGKMFAFTIPPTHNIAPNEYPVCGGGFMATQLGGPTTGGGVSPPINIQEYASINSGIVGLLSPVPQMLQFTNRMILALGNGYAPQYYADATGTAVNQTITFNANTFPTVVGTTANGGIFVHVNLPPPVVGNPTSYIVLNDGSSFILNNASPSSANGLGQVIHATTVAATGTAPAYTTTFTAYLFPPATAGGVGSQTITGGTITVTAAPLSNNFTVAFPKWAKGIAVNVGDIYQPATQPTSACLGLNTTTQGVYVRCTQAGITTTEPTWPDPCATKPTPGLFPIKNITEVPANATGSVTVPSSGAPIWEEVGWLNSVNPPPPGAAHAAIYSYCLFLWNTYPFQTGSASTGWGIDGPTSLRQSDVDNPFSWNPANQAFIDKDDGTEGMGIGTWTIAAVGIAPIGSLFLFKNYSSYQVTGLFGAGINIARIRTERGCTAPRTVRFIPGLGVARLTHLGVSVTDGVNDQLISDPVRPYLFFTNDKIVSDVDPIDPAWLPFSYADLCANPPMYNMLVPVWTGLQGASNGALTRSLSWDIGQRAWYPIDFPFNLSVISQQQFVPSASVTFLGGWDDGLIQRWQYDDQLWRSPGGNNSAGVFVAPSPVKWSYRTPVTASQNPDQRLFVQECSIKGLNSHSMGPITTTFNVDGVAWPPQVNLLQTRGNGSDFLAVASLMVTGQRFYADISGSGGVEIDGDNFHISPKPLVGRLVIA